MTREEAIKCIKIHMHIHRMAEDRAICITEALNMAIEALKVQEWIPVSEGLPEVDEDVWVTDDAGGLATVNIDSCGRYEDTGEKFWYTSQNVTAWMPMIIPEPYKEKKENGI